MKDIAINRRVTTSQLVSSIDAERYAGNLSSAVRLFVLNYYCQTRPVVRTPSAPAAGRHQGTFLGRPLYRLTIAHGFVLSRWPPGLLRTKAKTHQRTP